MMPRPAGVMGTTARMFARPNATNRSIGEMAVPKAKIKIHRLAASSNQLALAHPIVDHRVTRFSVNSLMRSATRSADMPGPGRRLGQDVTMRQTYIWTSIILAVVLFFSVMALLNMDLGKEKDTILYAKFLRVEDGIRN